MPSKRTCTRIAAAVLACASIAGGVAVASAGSSAERADSRSWSSFFETLRPAQAIDNRRVIVVFDSPSLADATAGKGTALTADEQRAFLKKATKRQERQLNKLRSQGIEFDVRHRYVKVLNGASLVVHGDALLWLRQAPGIRSVNQVRTVYPAATNAVDAAREELLSGDSLDLAPSGDTGDAPGGVAGVATNTGDNRIAGNDTPDASAPGATATTAGVVAVLDTAIDFNHDDLRGRQGGPGFDVIAGEVGPLASSADGHGTEVAGVIATSAASPVSIESVRVLESQPVIGGYESVLGHTDDLVAGFEYVVDRDRNGDTGDRASVALAAVSVPFGGFSDAPEALAVRGADQLGVVTVAAAGNDGASGDDVGTVGSPAAADEALAVGAADLRRSTPAADVALRGGLLDTVLKGLPLLTRATNLPSEERPVVAIEGDASEVVDYLGSDVRSRVAGGVALVERDPGTLVSDQVRAAADAGAVAVLIGDAANEAASGVVDVKGADIPAIGLTSSDARTLRDTLRAGPVKVNFDADSESGNRAFETVAGFSSRGPRYDGSVRPDVVAPGVGIVTAGVGRDDDGQPRHRVVSGSSVAAAAVAAQVATLRVAKPTMSPAAVRSAFIGTASLLGEPGSRVSLQAQGAGVVDGKAAARATLLASPARVQFGITEPGTRTEAALRFTAADGGSEVMFPVLLSEPGTPDGPQPSVTTNGLAVVVSLDTEPGVYGGWLSTRDGSVRVPWSVVVRKDAEATVPVTAKLSHARFKPHAGAGSFASRLTVLVGADERGGALGLRPAAGIRVRMLDNKARELGTVGALTDVLPGSYTFGLTGFAPAGDSVLPKGRYVLVVETKSTAADAKWIRSQRVPFQVR